MNDGIYEFLVHGDTIPEAYHKALYFLDCCGNIVPCPDYGKKRKEVAMTIVVANPFQEPMISKFGCCGPEALQKYRMEIVDGIMDFEIGKKWAYTYHGRIKDQRDFVIRELRRNPYSTRAVIDFRTPDDIDSSNPACLQNMQFFIRNGNLHLKVLMRSNDAFNATYANIFGFVSLQQSIANELGVEVGSYTHRANSFHAYEDYFDALHSAAERIFYAASQDSLAFNYAQDWDLLMLDAIPSILDKVNKQREKEDIHK